MKFKTIISWAIRLTAAIILLQTLYFKFTGHSQSVELFTKLGVEPWGRIGTGIIELITGILLIIPNTVILGAVLSLGLMGGAILSHLLVIGIESQGDGGTLFILALVVMACAISLLFLHNEQVKVLLAKYLKSKA